MCFESVHLAGTRSNVSVGQRMIEDPGRGKEWRQCQGQWWQERGVLTTFCFMYWDCVLWNGYGIGYTSIWHLQFCRVYLRNALMTSCWLERSTHFSPPNCVGAQERPGEKPWLNYRSENWTSRFVFKKIPMPFSRTKCKKSGGWGS